LACIGFSQAALASNWVDVYSASGALVYLDAESIAPRGKYMLAWWRIDYDSPQKTTTGYPRREYRSAKHLMAFNCAEKTLASVESLIFAGESGQGEVVDTYSVDWNKLTFTDPTPDPLGEQMLRLVCTSRPG
jgi:hypothetical protein